MRLFVIGLLVATVTSSYADSVMVSKTLPPGYEDPPGVRTFGCWGNDGFQYRRLNIPKPKLEQVQHYDKFVYPFLKKNNSKSDSDMCREAIDDIYKALKKDPGWNLEEWDIKTEAIIARCC